MSAMLARGCDLAVIALALLSLLPAPSQAELVHRAAAMNGTSTTASVLADLWQTTAVRRQHTETQRSGSGIRWAVRQQLGRAQAARRRWWGAAAAAAAYGAGRPRVTARFLAETQQNASEPSLQQQYAAVTQQLQAKAALLQSYAGQAAAVTQARYGNFARVAQVQLQQAAPSPPGTSSPALFTNSTAVGVACPWPSQCLVRSVC